MGFQKANITLGTGGIESGFIFNAQLFLKGTEWPWLTNCPWDLVLTEARKSSLSIRSIALVARPLEEIRGIRRIDISNSKQAAYGEMHAFSAKAASGSAEDATISITAWGEIFKRFSAYANDRRITPKMGILAGTFATTKEDADTHVKTGADAVSRYALENKKPASNVFTITPPSGTQLKRGTVQPAFGEVGGGVEVIFVNSSPDGIVTGPVKIPDK